MSRTILCTLLVLGIALPRAAHAEEGGANAALITIPSADSTPNEATEAMQGLSADLEERFPGQLLATEAIPNRLAGDDPRQRMNDAAAEAATAREIMSDFNDLELAVELLEGAAERYLLLLPLLEVVDEPLGLLRDLAAVFLALGQRDRLEASLAEAARLDPSLPVDESRDPSRIVNAARDVRERRSEGLAMLNPHIAVRYAQLLGVEYLAVARLEGGGRLRLEVYEGEAGRRTARMESEGDELLGAVGRLSQALSLESIETSGDVVGESGGETERPWYRSWWFITSIIVGVAVLATVTVVAVNAAQDE